MENEKGFFIKSYSYAAYNNYAGEMRSAEALTLIAADDNAFCVEIEREGGERTLQLANDDFCLIFPKTKYRFYTQPDLVTRIVLFEFGQKETAVSLARLMRSGEQVERLFGKDRDYVVATANKQFRELMFFLQNCHEQQYKLQVLDASVEYLLDALICKAAEAAFGKQTAVMLCQHTRGAIAYISKNYKKEITLSKLVKELGVGERRMQMLFKEELSTTFGEYLSAFRINKACDLLRRRNVSVEDVAALTGYKSRQNFTLAFKRKMGCTPQQFKMRVQSRNYRYRESEGGVLLKAFSSFEGAIVE